jgi:hypothetical protein
MSDGLGRRPSFEESLPYLPEVLASFQYFRGFQALWAVNPEKVTEGYFTAHRHPRHKKEGCPA